MIEMPEGTKAGGGKYFHENHSNLSGEEDMTNCLPPCCRDKSQIKKGNFEQIVLETWE